MSLTYDGQNGTFKISLGPDGVEVVGKEGEPLTQDEINKWLAEYAKDHEIKDISYTIKLGNTKYKIVIGDKG
jgi:hypothetical protein